jgi:hypothetical protein
MEKFYPIAEADKATVTAKQKIIPRLPRIGFAPCEQLPVYAMSDHPGRNFSASATWKSPISSAASARCEISA